jgi:hypothetical protein
MAYSIETTSCSIAFVTVANDNGDEGYELSGHSATLVGSPLHHHIVRQLFLDENEFYAFDNDWQTQGPSPS